MALVCSIIIHEVELNKENQGIVVYPYKFSDWKLRLQEHAWLSSSYQKYSIKFRDKVLNLTPVSVRNKYIGAKPEFYSKITT